MIDSKSKSNSSLRDAPNEDRPRAGHVDQLTRVEGDDDVPRAAALRHQSNAVGHRLAGHYIAEVDAHRSTEAGALDGEGAVLEDALHRVGQLHVEGELPPHLQRPPRVDLNLRPLDAKVVLLGPGLVGFLDGGHGIHLQQAEVHQLVGVVLRVDANAQDFLCDVGGGKVEIEIRN